jgi:hypothetical protein
MAILIGFLLFATIFCHFMNKWSRELEEMEDGGTEQPANNVLVGNFAQHAEQKRAA